LLKAWVTSTSWSNMDAKNIKGMHGHIYDSQVNGITSWAGIQRPPIWVGGVPNPGSAFTVREDGSYEMRRGHYFYKQVTCAAQPGMSVAQRMSMDSEVAVIAFASNGTNNADAIVVENWDEKDKKVSVRTKGSDSNAFEAFMTTERDKDNDGKLVGNGKNYVGAGTFEDKNGMIIFDALMGSVTTFFGN